MPACKAINGTTDLVRGSGYQQPDIGTWVIAIHQLLRPHWFVLHKPAIQVQEGTDTQTCILVFEASSATAGMLVNEGVSAQAGAH